MFAALKFMWRATAGHHLRPWRSAYIRWRVETYSGLPAEEVTAAVFFSFAWRERVALLRYLKWCGAMARHRRLSRHAAQSAQAGPAEAGSETA